MDTLPLDCNAIGNSWVFKMKANPDGSVNRVKARLVAQSFSHRAGVEYFDTL
jgi:hypothetical protein